MSHTLLLALPCSGNIGLIAVYPGVLNATELTCLNNYYSWRFPHSACPVSYPPPAPPPPVRTQMRPPALLKLCLVAAHCPG